jgi:hypothetical protein
MIVVVHDHAGAGEECKPAAKPPLVLVTAVSTHLSSASRAVKKNLPSILIEEVAKQHQ